MERITTGDRRGWDAWLKLASVVCTVVVVPGVGWAFQVQNTLVALQTQVAALNNQAEADRAGVTALLTELRELRRELANLKTDLAQRITRVETKLESR